MWMMEEVAKGLRKGTSAEELFATLTEVKSIKRFKCPIRVDLPLKPLLQLIKMADAHKWSDNPSIIKAALIFLKIPSGDNWYFMGSPVLRVETRMDYGDKWFARKFLVDACPAKPVVTRQMLVDAKLRMRMRATIAIQKQWHKSINDPSYAMCFKRLMPMFEAMMRE
jgi:hypothetical protein